ncbi:MAG: DUF3369 domain-containing protein [Methylococcaceae bacterium]|nr:DUF3369 domain-containing protein [Methylococcaceae bacterium]
MPEETIFLEYDIIDYKKKKSLDKKRLLITIYNAIRAYKDLINTEISHASLLFTRTGLETIINASNQLFNTHSLTEFATLLLEQLSALLAADEDMENVRASGLVASVNMSQGMNAILGKSQLKESIFQRTELYTYLDKAYVEKRSFFINDCFVGYFKAKHGNAMLVYLKNCKPVNSLSQSLLDIFSANISCALESIILEKEISDAQEDLIFRLGGFIETRSRETGNHVKRLAKLSYVLALELGLPEEEAKLIRKASALHDLGKVVIPDNILKKPGKLTAEEYDQIKQHSKFGYDVLNNSPRPLLKAAAVIAHQHHERYDGKGYPQGLEGEEIHFYARIVGVIDVFDALMHNRYYKEAWDLNKVLETLEGQRGKHFDPEIFDAFIKILPQALDIVAKHNDVTVD